MSKKVGKHLQFYMDCIETKEMPNAGLCCNAWRGYIDEDILDLFAPKNESPFAYWANRRRNDCAYKFNYLRQTIVLFMAAINNEL